MHSNVLKTNFLFSNLHCADIALLEQAGMWYTLLDSTISMYIYYIPSYVHGSEWKLWLGWLPVYSTNTQKDMDSKYYDQFSLLAVFESHAKTLLKLALYSTYPLTDHGNIQWLLITELHPNISNKSYEQHNRAAVATVRRCMWVSMLKANGEHSWLTARGRWSWWLVLGKSSCLSLVYITLIWWSVASLVGIACLMVAPACWYCPLIALLIGLRTRTSH